MSTNNNCVMTGRLTKEPEIRSGNNGKPFATFSIAVDRPYKDQNGQRIADFFDCIASREATVGYLANYCHKGNLITVTGEMETRTYQNKDGINVKTFNLRVSDATNRTSRAESAQQGNSYQQGNGYGQPGGYDNGQQYGNPQMPPAPSPMSGMGADVHFEEEVPF